MEPGDFGSVTFTVTEVSMLPGAEDAWHRHPGSEHAIVVFEGRGSILVGEVEEVLEPLKGIRVLPGRPHRVRNDGRHLLRYYVCASPGTDPDDRPATRRRPDPAARRLTYSIPPSPAVDRGARHDQEAHRVRPTKTVTSIGVIAFIIAAAITGLSAIPGTPWSGFVHPLAAVLRHVLRDPAAGRPPRPRRAERLSGGGG